MKTTITTRQEFREHIAGMIHYANGYYYIGDYQPATSSGRYATRDAAIDYQMSCFDRDQLDAHQIEEAR